MIIGLSDADCQVAGFRYRQLVAEGQQGRLVASGSSVADAPHLLPTPIRQQIGMLLVRVGQRMQGLPGGSGQSIGAVGAGEHGATV